ncbi:hypothetical protein [Algihabitans albus]|nr:hypothetical protein [Algihabitans albus]
MSFVSEQLFDVPFVATDTKEFTGFNHAFGTDLLGQITDFADQHTA